jgi:hypothetical protein
MSWSIHNTLSNACRIYLEKVVYPDLISSLIGIHIYWLGLEKLKSERQKILTGCGYGYLATNGIWDKT